MESVVSRFPTESPVQSNEQLTDAEGDGGVSRDDDGLVSTFWVSAVVNLKLQQNRKLSDTPAHQTVDWQPDYRDRGWRDSGSS